MAIKMEYTTVDRILAKLSRDLRGMDFNESDVIEWTGEALDALRIAPTEEEAVAFLEVREYEASFPANLQMVLQLAKDNDFTYSDNPDECGCSPQEIIKNPANNISCPNPGVRSVDGFPLITDCQGNILNDYEYVHYRPSFDLQWEYNGWCNSSYRQQFTPIRLSNGTFFGTDVARKKGGESYGPDEYTIVGTTSRRFRFSFREGRVAVAYLRAVVDPETGYPMIPDQYSFTSAIVYYIKWKLSESYAWRGRDGFQGLAQSSERLWLKYVRQAKNYAKMPKGIDQYQNMLEASFQLIPNHKRYYNFFGELGRPDQNRNPFSDYKDTGYRGTSTKNQIDYPGCSNKSSLGYKPCKNTMLYSVNNESVIISRFTQTEIDNGTFAIGELVYNTTTKRFQAWDGTSWVVLNDNYYIENNW